jgi:ATP-dependent RNA helicase DeaD
MIYKFKKLGISEQILKVLAEEKFEEPSEIQIKSIPLVLQGKDVIAGSATGSGKTLAFGSGIIQNSEKGQGIQALILTPTRELAEQITKALRKFSQYKPLNFVAVYGGLSINPQISKLRTADVVVATPGRLIDHITRGTIDLSKVKILVLDEADRMFEMGFIDDVERIIRVCPKKRQTLLFSATITREVSNLSRKHLKDPKEVLAESYVDPKKLKQVYYDVDNKMRFSLLVYLLAKEKEGLVMVFCNTRRTVDFVANNLKYLGINAQPIHGGFSQDKRSKSLSRFHSKKATILVCTDVAARGLDIKGVSHVYNYDIPVEPKHYIHRIGRTARAGEEGKAINLLSREQHAEYRAVLKENDVEIKKEITPQIERVKIKWVAKPRRFQGRSPQRGGQRRFQGRRPQRGGQRRGRRKGWKGRPTRRSR